MKRKQFLNRLLKISEMHESLNPIQDISLISNKMRQSKQIPQPTITRIMPIETNSYWQQSSIKSREIVVVKNELVTSKVLIHAKGNNTSCRKIPSRRRMKTTPTHSKLVASQAQDLSKILEDNYRSEYLDNYREHRNQCLTTEISNLSPIPHYLEIKQLQPKIQTRKVHHNSRPLKPALNQGQRYSKMKKHSLTEPTQNFARQSNTQRKLQIQTSKMQIKIQNNNSIRSDSFKKYRSMIDPSINQKLDHNKLKLSLRKEINKNYTKHFIPPPKLTAKSYIIYEVKQRREDSKVIVSFNSKNSQEVASLTKIMTCILSLQICQQFSINKATEQVTIGKMESSVGGTTASLSHGQIYTIDQLLLGLMLPSGNDASMALAIWAGRKLLQRQQQSKTIYNDQRINPKFTKIQCYSRFIAQMNTKAKQIGMNKTNYANSHGLMNPNNKSCAYDIALLCDYVMKNDNFRAVVKCKHYKGVIRYSQEYKKMEDKMYKIQNQDERSTDLSQPQQKQPLKQLSQISNRHFVQKNISVQWQNTHKLLHLKPKQYLGIKTGYTIAAGPCLSSYLSINGRNFIIIVLGCGRVNLRFKQTQILRKWLVKHENLKKKKVKISSNQLINDQQQQLQEQQVQYLLQNMKGDEETED